MTERVVLARIEPCTFNQRDFISFIWEFGLVAQLVRALACHARGRGFEPHPSRHSQKNMPRGFSSFGRAPPCQGGGGGFEPRNPLQSKHFVNSRCFLFCLGLEQVRVPFESHSRESSTSQVYILPRSLLCLTPFVKTTFSCFHFTNP